VAGSDRSMSPNETFVVHVDRDLLADLALHPDLHLLGDLEQAEAAGAGGGGLLVKEFLAAVAEGDNLAAGHGKAGAGFAELHLLLRGGRLLGVGRGRQQRGQFLLPEAARLHGLARGVPGIFAVVERHPAGNIAGFPRLGGGGKLRAAQDPPRVLPLEQQEAVPGRRQRVEIPGAQGRGAGEGREDENNFSCRFHVCLNIKPRCRPGFPGRQIQRPPLMISTAPSIYNRINKCPCL